MYFVNKLIRILREDFSKTLNTHWSVCFNDTTTFQFQWSMLRSTIMIVVVSALRKHQVTLKIRVIFLRHVRPSSTPKEHLCFFGNDRASLPLRHIALFLLWISIYYFYFYWIPFSLVIIYVQKFNKLDNSTTAASDRAADILLCLMPKWCAINGWRRTKYIVFVLKLVYNYLKEYIYN